MKKIENLFDFISNKIKINFLTKISNNDSMNKKIDFKNPLSEQNIKDKSFYFNKKKKLNLEF